MTEDTMYPTHTTSATGTFRVPAVSAPAPAAAAASAPEPVRGAAPTREAAPYPAAPYPAAPHPATPSLSGETSTGWATVPAVLLAAPEVPAARAQADEPEPVHTGLDIPHPQAEATHAGTATLRLRATDTGAAPPPPQPTPEPAARRPAPDPEPSPRPAAVPSPTPPHPEPATVRAPNPAEPRRGYAPASVADPRPARAAEPRRGFEPESEVDPSLAQAAESRREYAAEPSPAQPAESRREYAPAPVADPGSARAIAGSRTGFAPAGVAAGSAAPAEPTVAAQHEPAPRSARTPAPTTWPSARPAHAFAPAPAETGARVEPEPEPTPVAAPVPARHQAAAGSMPDPRPAPAEPRAGVERVPSPAPAKYQAPAGSQSSPAPAQQHAAAGPESSPAPAQYQAPAGAQSSPAPAQQHAAAGSEAGPRSVPAAVPAPAPAEPEVPAGSRPGPRPASAAAGDPEGSADRELRSPSATGSGAVRSGVPGPGVAEIVAQAVARGLEEEDGAQDAPVPHGTPLRGAAVTEVPVHLPFLGEQKKSLPTQAPAPARTPRPAAAARPAPGRRVPRGDERLREHRGPVLPGWIGVGIGGLALAGCAAVLWRAGAVPDAVVAAFGATPRAYRGLHATHWPPLAFLGIVALLALGGLGRSRAGHAWVLTLFGRYRGTVRRTGLTWISPLLLRRRVDVRLRHWRSDPMPAVDSGGLALQVVVQVVWQVKDTARAALAVEDHVEYLAEQVESAMARVLSQLPADAFHEDAPTLRDTEAVGDALTRMLAAETEAVGIEVFSAQPTRIEYAPEVAEAMRRRRVAAIDAKHRDAVLSSVVDAVDDTVHRLTSRGLVELDDYERKALVKDLTVAFYTGRSE
ncbi:SPFH domain-containing protein [Streptomyces sp. NPDC048270]|uniref:SPFH domain-containing protein n=1 Tax=Streptomyces sp. NPDC048270 TaxID=3154615 RepID=UPI0033EBE8CD